MKKITVKDNECAVIFDDKTDGSIGIKLLIGVKKGAEDRPITNSAMMALVCSYVYDLAEINPKKFEKLVKEAVNRHVEMTAELKKEKK